MLRGVLRGVQVGKLLERPPPCELLVALHACGGLSDAALRISAAAAASCLICTCCFNKNRVLLPRATYWGVAEQDAACLPYLLYLLN